MRRGFWIIGSALVLSIGCSAKVLTVGSGPAAEISGNDAGNANGDPGTTNSTGVAWSGYLENYALPSGSDVMDMTLRTSATGTVTGTVRFGTLPLLVPPTDPNVGYPPPIDDGGFQYGTSDSLEHFDFTILGGKVDGTRLTFTLASKEIFAQWCSIQTTIYPFYNGGSPDGGLTGYSCLPNGGEGENENGPGCFIDSPLLDGSVPVDCGKLGLCLGPGQDHPCSCTATACSVVMPSTGNLSFDMQVDGSPAAINGTVTGLFGGQPPNAGAIPIHFTKGS